MDRRQTQSQQPQQQQKFQCRNPILMIPETTTTVTVVSQQQQQHRNSNRNSNTTTSMKSCRQRQFKIQQQQQQQSRSSRCCYDCGRLLLLLLCASMMVLLLLLSYYSTTSVMMFGTRSSTALTTTTTTTFNTTMAPYNWNDHHTTASSGDEDDATNSSIGSRSRSNSNESPPKYAIFYNVYINPENVSLSLDIVRQQLAQWQNSRHASTATLYYTQLGDISVPFPCPNHNSTTTTTTGTTTTQPEQQPQPRCQLLQKKNKGDESDTLSKLYDYCQTHTHDHVIYLHSKGSFHPSDENHRARTVLTHAALSDDCHDGLTIHQHHPPTNSDNTTTQKCNICSARFSPLPHWHTPGNMWTAHCRYIQQLIPITSFERKVAAVVQQSKYKKYPPAFVGTGRFAYEHWVHTHPNMYPCDVYPDIQWLCGYRLLDDTLPLELIVPAPRNQLIITKEHAKAPLSYRLYELQQLYHAIPPNDSFAWTWYAQFNLL